MSPERVDTAVKLLETLKDSIGSVVGAAADLERQVRWLEDLVEAFVEHTAPGLKIKDDPGAYVREMASHPNAHIKRVLERGQQRWIESLRAAILE